MHVVTRLLFVLPWAYNALCTMLHDTSVKDCITLFLVVVLSVRTFTAAFQLLQTAAHIYTMSGPSLTSLFVVFCSLTVPFGCWGVVGGPAVVVACLLGTGSCASSQCFVAFGLGVFCQMPLFLRLCGVRSSVFHLVLDLSFSFSSGCCLSLASFGGPISGGLPEWVMSQIRVAGRPF